jgi:hypothetical protein
VRTTLFALGLALSAAAVHAAPCPAAGPLPEAPIKLSGTNPQYFSWKGSLIPLMGISYEYLCHIAQPQRQGAYCTLENFDSVLTALKAQKNNVIELWTIFNHSPGAMAYGAPFQDEQPFVAVDGKWDLRQISGTYLKNLESVVCAAYNREIFVVVTLLDPWDGAWTTSPFNSAQGFTERRFFARFEDAEAGKDTGRQNIDARTAQKNAVAAIVGRLKKYPNVIWEIANEPDLIPSAAADLGGPVTAAQVMQWQKAMLAVVQANDSQPPHLVAINGHSAGSFAWDVPGADIASAHYTEIQGPQLGALQIQHDASLAGARAKVATAFNEGQAVPSVKAPPGSPLQRTADDVRSEAWDFVFHGGALFNAYSLDRGSAESQAVAAQLGVLADFLRTLDLAAVKTASCNGAADWCQGIPEGQDISWSTLRASEISALYLHHSLPRSRLGGGRFDGYKAFPQSAGRQLAGFRFQAPRPGCWALEWIEPKTGAALAHSAYSIADADKTYPSKDRPSYAHDILIVLRPCRGR